MPAVILKIFYEENYLIMIVAELRKRHRHIKKGKTCIFHQDAVSNFLHFQNLKQSKMA